MDLDPSADLDRLDLQYDRDYNEFGQKMDDLIEYVYLPSTYTASCEGLLFVCPTINIAE